LVVPETVGVMVAVKIIDWLTVADGTEEASAVVVEVTPTD